MSSLQKIMKSHWNHRKWVATVFSSFHDPIANVMDDIFSQSPPLANYDLEKSIDTNFIQESISLSLLAGVCSQSSDESLHSWYEEKKHNPLDEISPSAHEFQDPYAVFLESD